MMYGVFDLNGALIAAFRNYAEAEAYCARESGALTGNLTFNRVQIWYEEEGCHHPGTYRGARCKLCGVVA